MVEWVKDKCPVCGDEYKYPVGVSYKPKTCHKFNCVGEYARHPEKYKTFIEHLDECRTRTLEHG